MAILPTSSSSGVTETEAHLSDLCQRIFLSPWAFSNIYRNQRAGQSHSDGKELCDALIVFGDHVLILSDKAIEIQDSGDEQLDWNRWHKKAILKSVSQIFGAERWIRDYPNRIFLDKSCPQPCPRLGELTSQTTYHRILVTRKISSRCLKSNPLGYGSLRIDPSLENVEDAAIPYHVGSSSSDGRFVHVFDDRSLATILNELDTTPDFIRYLTEKERAISEGRLSKPIEEQDLLASYLVHVDKSFKHAFKIDSRTGSLVLKSGAWRAVSSHPIYIDKKKQDSISYAWDHLIENIMHYTDPADVQSAGYSGNQSTEIEQALRVLASENRVQRRALAMEWRELQRRTRHGKTQVQVGHTKEDPDKTYVFMVASNPGRLDEEEFISGRGELLANYCKVAKRRFPKSKFILGIATRRATESPPRDTYLFFDVRNWSEMQADEAKQIQRELQLLTHHTKRTERIQEYPSAPKQVRRGGVRANWAKGRRRKR